MIHVLGPGHGKSIVVGYFLARLLVAVAIHDLIKLLKRKRLEAKGDRDLYEEPKAKRSSWKKLVAAYIYIMASFAGGLMVFLAGMFMLSI